MMLKLHNTGKISIAELADPETIISSLQDAVDLLGETYFSGCSSIIIREENLHPDFFRLHTKLAGDILQKFSNYQMKLAIVGDFSKYQSKSLQEFIGESNRGNKVFFVGNLEEAVSMLTGK
jgi:hypothetical protein